MDYRGLSAKCHQMIRDNADLNALITYVCSDPDCNVEIRHNYLNCYYKGGSLFRMELKPRSAQKLAFTFNAKYFHLKNMAHAEYSDLEKWHAAKPCKPKEWLDHLPELKCVMDAWFAENPKAERGIQGRLVKQNVFANGKYQSVDIELAIPNNQQAGRMDIIAVRREAEAGRYIPVIVELKHGMGAVSGKSGIGEHYKKTVGFLSGAVGDGLTGEAYLIETIRRIWTSKKELGLICEPVPKKEQFGTPELMFAVTGLAGGNTDKNVSTVRSLLPKEAEKYAVRIVISANEELRFDQENVLLQAKPRS